MAIRTTQEQVREIIETDSDLSIPPFISTASALVDWLHAEDDQTQLSDTLLERIECWLSAHFYETRAQKTDQRSTGRSNAKFQGQTAMVFMSSKWGQNACALDVTGRLGQRSKDAEMGLRRVAKLHWLGTPDQSPTPNSSI